MVTWEQFTRWLQDHDLPTATITRIELVPTHEGGVHLQAEAIKVNEHGMPVVRHTDAAEPQPLTETLVRPLVYVPGQQAPEPTS